MYNTIFAVSPPVLGTIWTCNCSYALTKGWNVQLNGSTRLTILSTPGGTGGCQHVKCCGGQCAQHVQDGGSLYLGMFENWEYPHCYFSREHDEKPVDLAGINCIILGQTRIRTVCPCRLQRSWVSSPRRQRLESVAEQHYSQSQQYATVLYRFYTYHTVYSTI